MLELFGIVEAVVLSRGSLSSYRAFWFRRGKWSGLDARK